MRRWSSRHRLRLLLALLAVALGAPSLVAADLAVATGAEVASRHVRRGMDLPTANEPAAAVWAAVAHEPSGLFAGVTATAVLINRRSPSETRRLDEVAFSTGWRRELSTPVGRVSGELSVQGFLYPRRISAGYGALVLEPALRVGLPDAPLRPAWHLHYDTTPCQTGWYGGLAAAIVPRLGDQPVEVVGELGWIESYLKQDTPNIGSAARAAGVVGVLAALAPAIMELEIALPVALRRILPARGGSFVATPYVRLVLTSPLVPALNPDGGEVVFGFRVSVGQR